MTQEGPHMTRISDAEIIAYHAAHRDRMTYPQMAAALGLSVGSFSGVIFRSRHPINRRQPGVAKIRLQSRSITASPSTPAA